MISLLTLLGLSFVLCLVLTPCARRLGRRYGLVDHPDARRKLHAGPIPVAGGVAVLLSVCGSLLGAFLVPGPLGEVFGEDYSRLVGLLLAAIVVCAVGVVDDYWSLRGRHKLMGQGLAIAFVMSSGLIVRSIRLCDWTVELGILAIPFTAFWLLGAINALNLLDGMDGLLSSVGIIISLAMAVMALAGEQTAAACVALALAGALLGFLYYNFPPASIFLGDAGSMLIGLVIGVLAIQSSLKAPATIALAAPLGILTIPIWDTTAAILRRKLTGRSIYTTDRCHLHHCLLRKGFTSQHVLLCVAGLCLVAVVGGLTSLAYQNDFLAIFASLVVIGTLVTTRLFGHAELLLIKERLISVVLSFWHRGPYRDGHQLEVHLQGSADWNELWNELTASAGELNLKRICLDVNAPAMHERYHARWTCGEDEGDHAGFWRVEIPLSHHQQPLGRLEITGEGDREAVSLSIATVAKLLAKCEAVVPRLTRSVAPPSAVAVESLARQLEPVQST
jgi:UDP-GlcNAc:undecaprenyl-phosphate GlcNAc-1-phosphate transferase